MMHFHKIRRQTRRTPQRRGTNRKSGSSPGLWLLTGIFVGILSVVSVYQFLTGKWSVDQFRNIGNKSQSAKLHRPPHILQPKQPIQTARSNAHAHASKVSHAEKHKAATPASAPKKDSAQRFEFYQLLPGMEVPIPDPDTAKSKAPNHNLQSKPTEGTAAQKLNAAGQKTSMAKTPSTSSATPTPIKPIAQSTKATTHGTSGTKPVLESASRTQKSAASPHPSSHPLKNSRSLKLFSRSEPKSKDNPPTKPKLAKLEKKLAAAQYLVQVETCRTLTAAEAVKARLNKQGYSPRIQKIEARDGLWYRVILGPFANESMAYQQKKRLAQQKIPAVLILQRK